jgi:hypothetical protein
VVLHHGWTSHSMWSDVLRKVSVEPIIADLVSRPDNWPVFDASPQEIGLDADINEVVTGKYLMLKKTLT